VHMPTRLSRQLAALPGRQLAALTRKQPATLRADRRFIGGVVLVLTVLLVAVLLHVLLQSRAAS
jgi:hypothetical protein